ncbi:hypothetical protein DFP72DRAFT_1083335 [Ephemerocybe angulata]|uniref:DUF6533 domain-containing protein n=1 Tax=Ephemerocybe angulata TaxID=980116 RepID=A0A8H6H994_9AGAR|nr:hypothetical protein DFP72DRAFT_1083335 [Tulosesus angulatus]
MSLAPEELAEIISHVHAYSVDEYISFGLYTACELWKCHYYTTTLAEEVSAIWSSRWRTGKVVFLLLRYAPLAWIALNSPVIFKTYPVHPLAVNVCTGFLISSDATSRTALIVSEIVVLVCLHALLGTRYRHLALIMIVYVGLTVGIYVPQFNYIVATNKAGPVDQFHQELGYACGGGTPDITDPMMHGVVVAGYVGLAKGICMFLFALAVLISRRMHHGGSLMISIRRDSGVYIVSLALIRLGSAITNAFHLRLGFENVPGTLQRIAIPMIASRLLLNMRKTEDPGVRSVVSTILFDTPRSENSESQLEEGGEVWKGQDATGTGMPMTEYAGIGRRKADGDVNLEDKDEERV